MSSEDEARKAQAQRVEEARQKIVAMQKAALEKAPEMTEQLLLGDDYYEYELVRLTNGNEVKVKVYAIAEGDILQVQALFPAFDLMKVEMRKDWGAMVEVARIATKMKRETIEKHFVAGSSWPIATHALKISGYGRSEDITDFLGELDKGTS